VVDAFARVLRFARVWSRIKDDVRRLPEHAPPVGRVLVPAEKDRLFLTAASNPSWLAAYCAAVIAVNTTLRACELRSLRWSDVDFLDRKVTVRGSKTDAGLRRIPLNEVQWWASECCGNGASS
jgi:integrase